MSEPHVETDLLPLTSAALPRLAERGLAVPTYDRDRLRPRILHIGVGGFHRAHLAMYVDLLAAQGSDWGICGVGLLPHDQAMADALAAQDHLYTFTAKGPDEPVSQVVGSIVDYLLADEDVAPVVARVADPETAIVSLTVTEGGYDDTDRNRRTFDVVAQGLAARRAADGGGVTLLSCDNLPGNGQATRRCVLAAAERLGDDLAAWVEQTCTFPDSMVDRITPQTSDADREHLREAFGVEDRWPVVGEPFWQWVLQDDFAAGRPPFDQAGALFTDDVHAWELYKLRLLNAGHSCMSYLCALAGITYVDEALADPDVRGFLEHLLLDEAVPTLDEIPGHPREEYATTVVERFANTGIRDQVSRLCMDGTSKFPTMLAPTLAGAVADGTPLERAACALAGWAHYLADVPEDEQAPDPAATSTRPLARAASEDPLAFLQDNPVLPPEVAGDDRFRAAFERSHREISAHGALGAIRAID